jgi:arginase family enzyme
MSQIPLNGQALTVFQGRAGDHNDLAMQGSVLLGDELAGRLGLTARYIGQPEPALNTDWERELAAARPVLTEMQAAYERIFDAGAVPVTALSRCTVALATLPVVARHRQDACIVWFDAHADLNTPHNTATGYLGGMALSGAAGLWDTGLGGDLSTSNIVLGGIRDLDPPEQHLVDEGIVGAVLMGTELAGRLREAIAERPVYVHLDCDVLDPGIVPTDYRVPGGMSLEDLHMVAGMLAEHEIVGVEIAELEGAWTANDDPFSPSRMLDAMQPLLDATSR